MLQSLPLLKASVVVLEKTSKYTLQYIGKAWFRKLHLCIVFAFANGETRVFEVKSEKYNIIHEGDQGILFFKQKNEKLFFIDFVQS